MSIQGGFIGLVYINGVPVRTRDCSVNLTQETLFYDHIIGLNDSIPTDLSTKGEVPGTLNYQKYLWRPGVKAVVGNLSFPVTNVSLLTSLFNTAKYGGNFSLTMFFDCAMKRVFNICKINTFNFTIEAGEILAISVDIIAADMTEEYGTITVTPNLLIEKMVTWDKVSVVPVLSSDPIRHFEFTINNNCIPIYTHRSISTNDFFPIKIRNGMQEVNGNIVFYIKGSNYIGLDETTTSSTIQLTVDTFSTTMNVIYKPVSRATSIGFIPNTFSFVGCGKPFGT